MLNEGVVPVVGSPIAFYWVADANNEAVMPYRDILYQRYQSTFKHTACTGAKSAIFPNRTDPLYAFRGWIPVDPSIAIMDIGCGAGDLLLALKGRGYSNLFGVNLGPEQIASARGAGLDVLQAEANNFLRTAERKFQLMFACDVLEHLTRDEAIELLNAARCAAAPGAVLLLRMPNASAPRGSVCQYGDLTHETPYSPLSLRQLCGGVGISDVRIRDVATPPDAPVRAIRRSLWEGMKLVYKALDMIEAGAAAEGYTRNMVARIQF